MSESIFSIRQWRGLNRNPDGDTRLKPGEAADMRNFRITADGSLKKRPGTRTAARLGTAPVTALWSGELGGRELLCAICGKGVFIVTKGGTPRKIGELGSAPERASIFAFDSKLWLLTGSGYYCWDGEVFGAVEGYVPLVKLGITPTGPGELLEGINRLSPLRMALLSPDGEGKTFALGEQGIGSIEFVRSEADGSDITGYTFNSEQGTLTFGTAPDEGVNTIRVCWRVSASQRESVEKMLFAELYNGTQDTRVFLYGSGSAAIYSGIDQSGRPRADYFPDLNEIAVGEPGTDITGMIRHHSSLVCFKRDSAWLIRHELTEDAEGLTTAAFYLLPVHRSLGSESPGQLQSVMNSIITLHGGSALEWVSGYLTNSGGSDERSARRISGRVGDIIATFPAADTLMFDDNREQELYIHCGSRTLVWSYGIDAWFQYTGLSIRSMARFDGSLYFGTDDGLLCRFGSEFYSDERDGVFSPIDCYWESGSMDFDRPARYKSSHRIYLSVKPESRTDLTVGVLTERGKGSREEQLRQRLFSFAHLDFSALRFCINRAPEPVSIRISASRFANYKLLLSSATTDSTVTLTGADIRVRYGGSLN